MTNFESCVAPFFFFFSVVETLCPPTRGLVLFVGYTPFPRRNVTPSVVRESAYLREGTFFSKTREHLSNQSPKNQPLTGLNPKRSNPFGLNLN